MGEYMAQEHIRALEEINLHYIENYGPLSSSGKWMKLSEGFKSAFPKEMASEFLGEWRSHRARRKSSGLCCYAPSEFQLEYASPMPVSNKQGVVYTCTYDGYDSVREPYLANVNVNYVVYGDGGLSVPEGSAWEHREMTPPPFFFLDSR